MSQLRHRQRYTGANGGLASGRSRLARPSQPTLLTALLSWTPYAVASVTNMTTLSQRRLAISEPLKLVLMPLAALALAFTGGTRIPLAARAALAAALAFSWVGDNVAVLLPPAIPYVPAMLVSFGIAHAAYIPLFTGYAALRPAVPTLAYLVIGTWYCAILYAVGAGAGALLPGVAAYGLLLGGTALCAARCSWVVVVGAAMFLASDTLLAFRLFRPEVLPESWAWVIMGTYEVGQGMIGGGVVATLLRRGGDVGKKMY